MRFACEQCHTKYSIPDERVRGKLLKFTCKKCGCLMRISEGGVRAVLEAGSGGPDAPGGGLGDAGEGGDSTMIGGMADFFGGLNQEVADWHLSIDGNLVGPMRLEELANRIADEEREPAKDLYGWREGFAEWLPPAQIPDLQPALIKARADAKRKPAAKKPAPLPVPAAHASSDEGEATQIGGLDFNAALEKFKATKGLPAPEPEAEDPSGLMLDSVDEFDEVADLPSPLKAGSKPPAMPKPRPAPPPISPAAKPSPPPAAMAPKPPMAEPAPPRPTPASIPTPAPPVSAPSVSAPPPAIDPGLSGQSIGAIPTGSIPPVSGIPPVSSRPDPIAAPPPSFGAPMGGAGDLSGDPTGMALPKSIGEPPKKRSIVPFVLVGLLVVGGGGAAAYFLRGQGPKPTVEAAQDAGADAGKPVEAKVEKPPEPPKKPAVEGLAGLTEEQLKTFTDSSADALGKCYQKATKKDDSLDGKVLKVEMEVAGKGKVKTVTVTGVDDDKLGKCVQKAVKRWKFDKGDDRTVKFPLTVKK